MIGQLSNIDLASVYMTCGRDSSATRYEYLIGAQEIVPSCIALDGEAFPITLAKQGGYRSKSAAHTAGLAWCAGNLPIEESL